MYLDTSTFPLLPVLGFLGCVLWCIFRGLSCHTENLCKCTHGVWEEKKGSVLSHSLLPLPPSANFLGSPSCEVKSWKKVKKLKKHFVMFVYSTLYCFLVSVLIHVISSAIPSKVLFVSHFKCFLKTSFWSREKKNLLISPLYRNYIEKGYFSF